MKLRLATGGTSDADEAVLGNPGRWFFDRRQEQARLKNNVLTLLPPWHKTSGLEGRKRFADEVCIFPCCFVRSHCVPVDEPLWNGDVVVAGTPWNLSALENSQRIVFELPVGVSSGRVGFGTARGPRCFFS
jgi:hypothetical protein